MRKFVHWVLLVWVVTVVIAVTYGLGFLDSKRPSAPVLIGVE